MQLWIETSDISLIEKGVGQGMVQGVVTTPALLLQSEKPQRLIEELTKAQRGSVVIDVLSDFEAVGAEMASISSQVLLRIPLVEQAWEALHHFSMNKVPVMAGAIFSPLHALLAARSGAAYVAPHLSRMLKSGDRPFEQIESIQKMISNYPFSTQVIVLHPKTMEQVKACAEIGVAGVIVREDLYRELLETHELAAFHVEQWNADWKSFLQKL